MGDKVMMKILIAVGLLLLLIGTASAEVTIDEFTAFLAEDQTDTHEYLPWYSCGHYSRDLARNASGYNLSIGSVILSNHPVFRGYNNHAMNYIVENDTIWVIEPQTDQIMTLQDTMYGYYRLYPDGTQVPSNWAVNLAYTGVIE